MKSYIVIVAHPDDEILFFSSLLAKARKVLICFGPSYDKVISSGRRALKKDFPLLDRGVHLADLIPKRSSLSNLLL